MPSLDLHTRLIHAGEPRPRLEGAIAMPVYQSATYESVVEDAGPRYARLSNTPNHEVLHRKLAQLEGGEAGLVTASGMAAITTTLLASLSPGEHMLAQRCLYGGTLDFITDTLARFGVTTTFVDAEDPSAWKRALQPNTKVMYVEAMTNPLLEVACLPEAAAFAAKHELVSVIDSTFAPPVLFRPLEHGFDVVLHSATKYLNGHSDITAGSIVTSRARMVGIARLLTQLGGSLDPHACVLLHRGLKTLGVRVRRQCDTALEIARFLAEHPSVVRVAYPGLAEHAGHARARSLFSGFGGVLSVELRGGAPAAETCARATELFIHAPSLGGVESLVSIPARTSHRGLSGEGLRALGIADGLIRLSVGLEDPGDLIADLQSALSRGRVSRRG